MRKLATGAFSFAAGVFLAQVLLPLSWRPWAGVLLCLLAFAALILHGNRRTRALLVLLCAAVGVAWNWGHYLLFLRPGDALAGQSVKASVTVTEYSEQLDGYGRVYARISGEGIPNVRTAVYDYEGILPPLSPGDSFTAELRLVSAVKSRGEETAAFSSRGVYLRAYVKGEISSVSSSWQVRYLPQYVAHFIRQTIDECFPKSVAPFYKALLTGDRTELREDLELYTAMSTVGILHIVAISGMHIAFLLGLVRLLTGRGRITALIGIPLIVFFALMTGGSPSVIRAAVMQIFLLLAPLLRRENDPLTALSAALALLLALNPAASASVSLQLSFAAIAGILAFSGRIYAALSGLAFVQRAGGRPAGAAVCRFVISSVSSSLGATVFSLPLLAYYFGSVPLYAPLANLLCLWAVSLMFCLGFAAVGLYLIWHAAGQALAWLLSVLARYLFAVVRGIARLPYAAVYTQDRLVLAWIALCYLLFALMWILHRREKAASFRPVLPACLCLVLLCCVLLTEGLSDKVAVLDVGQGACTVFTSGNTAVVIDCGSTISSESAGKHCADYLLSEGQRDVDLLALTHLHEDHCNGVTELFARMQVRRLALPMDADDSDEMLEKIISCAENHGTEIVYIENQWAATSGELRVEAVVLRSQGEENERGALYLVSVDTFDTLVTGDAGIEVETESLRFFAPESLELLVAGHHGSAGSSGAALLSALRPEYAAISCGTGNSYGHPAEETLGRLIYSGAQVLRTDEAGDILFRLK